MAGDVWGGFGARERSRKAEERIKNGSSWTEIDGDKRGQAK